MKKICIVTTVSITMKSFVVETAKHLHNACGYDVTLICSPDEAFAASLPEYLHFIPVEMPRGIDLAGFSAIKKLRKIFRKEKFDLVQYSTPNASCYASIAAKRERVPVRLYAQWGIRYVGLSGVSRRIFKFLEKLTCRNSTHVRSQSPKNMQFIIDEKVCKAEKIGVIGIGGTIGVDLKMCDAIDRQRERGVLREKLGISQNAFVFGFVGRINKDKGVGELLTAFKRFGETYDSARLLLIGGIDEKNPIEASLLEYAKASEKVVLAGFVPSEEVCSYMTAMDVLVHPTYREGFGKVIQEAMGMSLPVITTNIPGPSEVIENGVSGILANVKDSEDLFEKMKMVFLDEPMRISFAKAGRARAEKYFDRPIMLDNIAREMEAILR